MSFVSGLNYTRVKKKDAASALRPLWFSVHLNTERHETQELWMKQCASGERRAQREWERKRAVSPLPVSRRAESGARAGDRARAPPSAPDAARPGPTRRPRPHSTVSLANVENAEQIVLAYKSRTPDFGIINLLDCQSNFNSRYRYVYS